LLFFISLHNSKTIEQRSTQNFQWQIQSRKTFTKGCSSFFFLSLIKAAALPVTYYMLGYFSTSYGPQTFVKNGSTSVIYQNSMQKSMDQIKVLLLSDSETQNAEKNNDCLEKEITEIAKKNTIAASSNPSICLERKVNSASEIGDDAISDLLSKFQASINKQEESMEAISTCRKVLLKRCKEGYPSVAILQERVVNQNCKSDICRMILENINFLCLSLMEIKKNHLPHLNTQMWRFLFYLSIGLF